MQDPTILGSLVAGFRGADPNAEAREKLAVQGRENQAEATQRLMEQHRHEEAIAVANMAPEQFLDGKRNAAFKALDAAAKAGYYEARMNTAHKMSRWVGRLAAATLGTIYYRAKGIIRGAAKTIYRFLANPTSWKVGVLLLAHGVGTGMQEAGVFESFGAPSQEFWGLSVARIAANAVFDANRQMIENGGYSNPFAYMQAAKSIILLPSDAVAFLVKHTILIPTYVSGYIVALEEFFGNILSIALQPLIAVTQPVAEFFTGPTQSG